MTHFAYMFEAKGIQRYIFASGKLRDVVGASDLVAGLASSDGASDDAAKKYPDKIGELLGELVLTLQFSRRAGGAFCIHSDDKADLVLLRARWRLYVMRALPGLEFTEGFGEGATEIAAMKDAFANSSGIRSNSVAEILPLGRPIHDYAPMTGRSHVFAKRYRDDKVLLDSVTLPQRERADYLQGKMDGVAKRFLSEARLKETRTAKPQLLNQHEKLSDHLYAFPRNFDPHEYKEETAEHLEDEETNPLFPFRNPSDWWEWNNDPSDPAKTFAYPKHIPEDRRYALVHADLSGLGELFQSFSTEQKPGSNAAPAFTLAAQNLALATAIETEIIAAAKATTETILGACGDSHGRKIIPMRPILLGGDDITFIIRADLAIDYTTTLLEEIETRLAEVDLIKAGPTRLSACAGIAIVRPGTPFLSANILAESLCKFAKVVVKAVPEPEPKPEGYRKGYASAIAFHLQHQTAHEEYEGDIWQEASDAEGRVLSANPFGVGLRKKELGKTICDLRGLAEAINAAPSGHGTLRQIQSLINEDVGQATARWRRWLDVGKDVDKKAIAKLLKCDADTAPCGSTAAYDALVLIDIGALDPLPPPRPPNETAATT